MQQASCQVGSSYHVDKLTGFCIMYNVKWLKSLARHTPIFALGMSVFVSVAGTRYKSTASSRRQDWFETAVLLVSTLKKFNLSRFLGK